MRAVVILLAIVALASSCANDGRDLQDARDWQTTTTRPPPPTSALPQEISPTGLTLSSPDFEPGADAPQRTRCTGDNRFPNLEWSGVPDTASELAVTLSDQTDPTAPLLLWMMGGIDPSATSLDSGFLPVGGYETLNDYGQPGWGSPCLEAVGAGQRDLQFRLYVLDVPSGLSANAPGNEAWDTITASATDSATLLMRIDAIAS